MEGGPQRDGLSFNFKGYCNAQNDQKIKALSVRSHTALPKVKNARHFLFIDWFLF
jgi:hypothetical protein